MRHIFSFLLLACMLTAQIALAAGSYSTNASGVTVSVEQSSNVKKVRLQIITDNIIRVSATAEDNFADKESLVVVPLPMVHTYNIVQHGDTVILTTAALKAHVLTTTGEVWFTDCDGKMIVREKQGGGKTFTPYTCEQVLANGTPQTYKGWTIRQVFENIFPNEGLYGLGQHQGDEWNWKGRNEELFQYNTKVSIPFVVSSEGYGLLFDTYSLCRFGNPLPYSQLGELFDLKDMKGKKGALTGTYTAEGQKTVVRREDSLYFEDIFTGKNLPKGFKLDNATVVYEGTIIPRQTGTYHFNHYYSGYQQIFIDGKPLSDQIWRTAWNPNSRKYAVEMVTGRPYHLRLEWKPDGGEAYCGLRAYAPVAEEEQQQLSMWSEMSQQLDYYFIWGKHAETLDPVIAGYRQLTGKAPIMPEWVHGYWQSRERYKSQDEILTALDGFRQRHLPIDNIVMDWNYWVDDQWGAFKFDPARFADPQEMIDSIHRQHAKIMISCWPKYYFATDNFRELQDKGYIYQQSIKDSLYDWLGYKYAFYDAYHPEAREIFWRQLWENLGVMGMDAWWMDASEPNVRDCTPIEYRKLLCGPTYLGSSDEYFNAYALVNAEAIYDGQRRTQSALHPELPLPRVFLLTRNGFSGQQRYSTATWSGDIGTRWEDLKAQITAGLNFCISGIPYWSQDIGGFSVEKRYMAAQSKYDATHEETEDLKEWRELNARWHQWGMFTPMYRSHGQFPLREPWEIAPEGHEAYESIRECLNLRYRLMPYIYSLAARVHFDDYTMMRPLVMDFSADKRVRDNGYQYMFGPALMVCPVYTYKARQRNVYFPQTKGGWYDFYTGALASEGGEEHCVRAPYTRTPLYVRAGSILPFGPAMEYTHQQAADTIRLYVYEGADARFTLYEDEGDNYNYEQGQYATIPFVYNEAAHTLTIGERSGSFPGMLAERTFIIVRVNKAQAHAYDPQAEGISVRYDGHAQTIAFFSSPISDKRLLPYQDASLPVEVRVEDALSRMTLREKCRLSYAQSKFTSPGCPRLGIPELRMSDGPHGVRMEINWNDWAHSEWTSDSCTAFPALTCLAATWDPELAMAYGVNVGEEALYRGKNVLLGPGVNIYRTPLNGRNFEYLGEDPFLASTMCVPYIRGLQSNGVACCVKHYVLNNQEEYRGHVDVKVSDRALYEIYLPAFKAAVQQGEAWSLMGSYNQYRGEHCSHNQYLLDDILKGEFGFRGAVITDWGAAHDTYQSVFNGLDLEMGSYTNGLTTEATGFGYDDYYLGNAYYQMALNGQVPDSIVNDKARRMLTLIFRTALNSSKQIGALNSPEHKMVARRIAQDGVVLLKNDEQLLPLNAVRYKKVLVVGENATRSLCEGGGSSELKVQDEVSPLRGLQERFPEWQITYMPGYKSGITSYHGIDDIPAAEQHRLADQAIAQADEADLIIYIGGLNKNHFEDCEGGDRRSFHLSYEQDRLIAALAAKHKPMVTILVSGNAVAMPWLNDVSTLVQSWYLGSEAGHALADVLSGDVCPSGKTVFTYAASLEDYPSHKYGLVGYPGVEPSALPAQYRWGVSESPRSADLLKAVRTKADPLIINTGILVSDHNGHGNEVQVYAEDILVGYRYFETMHQPVLFPFGYGLSYTTFSYTDAQITAAGNNKWIVTLNVTNTGRCAGKEVVQLYIGDDKASVVRPVKELKHFCKVALQAGETRQVTFTITEEDLQFFDEVRHAWVSEPGTFKAYIGASSADIRAILPFRL